MKDNLTLNNGISIPLLGFGVFRMEEGKETVESVKNAISTGYRLIDTARGYHNEESVGKAIKESGIGREDIFITTKLWNEDTRKKRGRDAFFESLKSLDLEYLDLYLIHWPTDGYQEAWNEMEKLYEEGYIKSIGVSNFQPHHLEELKKNSDVIPAVNQVEFHPKLTQGVLRKYLKENNILMQAWSPLGGAKGNLFINETLMDMAKRYNKSVAQIIIRWDIQQDILTIPKSSKPHRIKENFDVFDFELSKEDVDIISGLNENHRFGSDPDNFDF